MFSNSINIYSKYGGEMPKLKGPAIKIAEGKFIKCGHLANIENAYRGSHGYPQCRQCKRERLKLGNNIEDGKFKKCLHDATEDNIVLSKRGTKSCRKCGKQRELKRRMSENERNYMW